MKGLWILAALVAVAALLVMLLVRGSSADLERKYDEAVRERATIEKALAEAAELVRWFADRKPTEKKKGELEELRRRFDALEKAARTARDDETRPRDERIKELVRLGGDYYQLARDAEDLLARLREMKRFDGELQERIKKLGLLTRQLSDAKVASRESEFQQRAGDLLEEGRKFRQMAEGALKTLAHSIADGRPVGLSALNELDDVMKRMEQLLAAHPELQPAAGGG